MDEQTTPTIPEELAKLQKLADEHLAGWQRAKADYLNLKRQAEKEREDIAKYAQAGAVLQFLPIYDNLKRAATHIPDEQKSQDWVKGLTHIQKQFEDILKTMGLTPITTIGSTFDPNLHHAVHKVSGLKAGSGSAGKPVPSGTIVEEVKSGFMLGDRVLEPAQVTVAE